MTGAAEARLAAVMARIAELNPALRIFLETDRDGALAAARAADRRAASGRGRGPLDGRIVAVKANIAMRGLAWSAGTRGWAGRIARDDANAVARLRAAGAVILGSVNMDEGALGVMCDNPVFGPCRNPRDPALSPGGSSGGSGAALAAGLADLALGTDTLGSVRIPAAACAVAGLKPTRGLIGRAGLAHLSPSLDCIGPMAGHARALAPALAVLAGPDPEDPDSRAAPLLPDRPLAGARLVLPAEALAAPGDGAMRAGLARACDAARDLGAQLVEAPLAGWDPGRARRAGLLLAEAEGAVAMAELLDRPGALSPALAGALAHGRGADSARLVTALARIRAAAGAARRALDAADALIMPTAPHGALAHGSPPPPDQADLTALANLAGLPAVAFPVPVAGGAPASVQLVGPPFADARLIGWAAALQDALAA